ncbi:hypothetical protein, partial [Streptomyces prunicolor]|uniref:hypothetical protein n=1 Tax=Streptomyces prunicolor TaxID=67348 RepID=UPI0033E5CA6A
KKIPYAIQGYTGKQLRAAYGAGKYTGKAFLELRPATDRTATPRPRRRHPRPPLTLPRRPPRSTVPALTPDAHAADIRTRRTNHPRGNPEQALSTDTPLNTRRWGRCR